MQVHTIGLDIAKSVFQVHGVDTQGETVMRERMTRGKVKRFFKQLDPRLVGIEACAPPTIGVASCTVSDMR